MPAPQPPPSDPPRPAEAAHHELPPLADPGKEDRAAHGLPVVPAFDGYRALAIMAIVCFHVLTTSGVVTEAAGSFGGQMIWGVLPQLVDVLFIVSGFVVFLPTVARRGDFGSVGAYAIRRAARLMPAFWLSLVILLGVMAALPTVPLPGLAGAVGNFTGLDTIGEMLAPNDLVVGFGINLPLWTLTLEVSFYIVLPFIAASYWRRPLLGLAIAAVIAILWREAFAHLGDLAALFGHHPAPQELLRLRLAAGGQLPNWAFSFAAGMTGAWAYVRLRELHDPAKLRRIAPRVATGALLSLALFVYLTGRYAIDTPVPLPALVARQSSFIALGYTASLATVMIAITLCSRRLQLPFAHPRVRRLGDISYGVYLIHAVVLFFVLVQFSVPSNASLSSVLIFGAIAIPVSLAYGYASARFLEQPIRRWARRFGRRAQSSHEARAGLSEPTASS